MTEQRPVRIGINGFGRIGRLALRALWDHAEVEVVQINEIAGDAATAAAVFGLQANQVSNPVQAGVGFAVAKVTAVQPAAPATLGRLPPKAGPVGVLARPQKPLA